MTGPNLGCTPRGLGKTGSPSVKKTTMKTTRAIYYAPVRKEFFSKWEFYKTDLDLLENAFDKVIVCYSFLDIIKNILSADLVYCWWWHRSSLVVLLSRLLKIRVFVTGAIYMLDMSGSGDFYSKSLFYRLSARVSLFMATKNIFISEDQLRQTTVRLNVNEPTLLMLSLNKTRNFSLQKVQERRQRASARDKKSFCFTTICWHMPDQYRRKGVYETLHALSLYKKNINRDFHWSVVGGDGSGAKELQVKIDDAGLSDNVSVLTNVSSAEKEDILLGTDLYIQPSWCEGFGNAVLEGMSYGIPAIVSRYTAQPEVVGGTGFVVMEISPEAVFEEIKKFTALTHQENERMSERVLGRVSKLFTFDKRAARFAEIIS